MKHLVGLMTVILMLLTVHPSAVQAGGPPQVRVDSDAHWDWRDDLWPNAEEAVMIRKAAESGDAESQFKLALMHDAGQGVLQDSTETSKWLNKAADQGHVEAQYNLATMYEEGRGVTQDHASATRWYRAAAEQGYSSAQKNLAVKFGLGQGVPQSDIEAYIWSAIAALSGDEGAVGNRNLAASKLSATELESAQRRAAKRYHEIQRKQAG